MKNKNSVHIRWMMVRDMPAVLAIENQSLEYVWSEDDFIRCLRHQSCVGMVAKLNGKIVGFMIYELHKNRLHILNLAVHPDARRKGVANSMVSILVGKLSQERRNRIMVEVRETNIGAQLAFSRLGFRAIPIVHYFYRNSDEPVYLMQYRLALTLNESTAVDILMRQWEKHKQ